MITGTQLRILRQARGLPQKTLADKMNIGQQRISALEKKKELTDQCSYKAFKALRFTKEEAIHFLKTLPSLSGGGVNIPG